MVEVTEIPQEKQADLIKKSEIDRPLLDKPVLCLLLDPQPLEPFSPEKGQSPKEVRLRSRLRPRFTPFLITDQDLSNWAFEDVDLVDFYGPFRVYRPKGNIYHPATTYGDRESFRKRRENLVNWCHLPEMDSPLTTETQDKNGENGEVADEAEPSEVKTTLHPKEAGILRKQLSQLLDQELIVRVEASASLVECPEALLQGLTNVVAELSLLGTHSSLQEFSAQNLDRLKVFTAKEVARLEKLGNEHPEDILESIVGIEGFDIVIEMIKSQSKLLTEPKGALSHKGVMIPFTRFEGKPSYSPNASLEIRKEELVIKSDGKEYKFPLPARHGASEICYKGGLARVLAKIALGEDISGELPVHDVDLVVFGKSGLPLKEVAEKYLTNARDIERLEEGSYESYCATRDSAFNEVLVNPDGVFISFNALSSMYQGFTQTAGDDTSESLFNKHFFSVYKPDLITGKERAYEKFVYVGKERFPSPVTLSRMFKLLIDGKCNGVVVPEGVTKTDPGIYWLVMARKILSEEDPAIREVKMERMLTLAEFVESPFYKSLSGKEKDSPEAFLESLKETYPDFDMGESLSDKDTILWVVQKLRNQIIRAFMRSVGYPDEKSLQKKLEPSDLDLKVITLPPLEAYGIVNVNQKEIDREEQIRTRRIREARNRFESAAIKPSHQQQQTEKRMREFISRTYGTTGSTEDLGKMYYIPIDRRQEFLQAFENNDYKVDHAMQGGSFYVSGELFSFIILDDGCDPIRSEQIFFEEFYHASGKELVHNFELMRKGYSVAVIQKEWWGERTDLLEEGMAGLEWVEYKREEITQNTEVGKQIRRAINLGKEAGLVDDYGNVQFEVGNTALQIPMDFVTFIFDKTTPEGVKYVFSPSSLVASLLDVIIKNCGGREMLELMRTARQGDVATLREVSRRIEKTFGRGSYGRLLKTSANNLLEIEKMKKEFIAKEIPKGRGL